MDRAATDQESNVVKVAPSGTRLYVQHHGNMHMDARRMAGVPDGMGAYDNGDGTFTLLVNHEIPSRLRVKRAHGSVGAFVSEWIINKQTLAVYSYMRRPWDLNLDAGLRERDLELTPSRAGIV